MKKTNTTTTATLDPIDQLARTATAGTLKRIHDASANDNIRKLRQSLQADFISLDNKIPSYIVSDAYDLYVLAYSYLYEKIVIDGLNSQTPITVTLKSGKEKTRTVYQWACTLVRKEIYANKSIENTGKYTYIEDLTTSTTDTAAEALDRAYIRMGKYDGIQTNADYERYEEMLVSLDLTTRQRQLVIMRMQGLSLNAIAERLNVTPQTLNTQLSRIRQRAIELFPDAVRFFNLDKHSR